MKKILGLDIGTNSIGWALIETNAYENPESLDGKIVGIGSRIIPMDGDALTKFENGTPESKAAARRQARGARRLNQRYKLRRARLIDTLIKLGWIPDNFPNERSHPKIFKNLDKHYINEYLPYSISLIREARAYFGIENKINAMGEGYNIPEDWLIYFLKVKALYKKVSLPELARILYHYNQRRGFKSSRKDKKEEIENNEIKYPITEKWIEIIKVTKIENSGQGEGKDKEYTFYTVSCQASSFEFTAIKKRKNPLDWVGKNIEVEITKKTTKDQTVTYNISEVDQNAWENRKLALEKDVEKSGLFISEYYLQNLKKDRDYRIKQRIVDRRFYQEEFKAIWDNQAKHYENEFNDKPKTQNIAETLYHHNQDKIKELSNKGLFHILFNDIIYYQRGLKSQKSQLANCTYESKIYKDKDGKEVRVGVKVTSRSNPFFQEFRIWQTIHNLKLILKETNINGKLALNMDVSNDFLNHKAKETIFELFDNSKEVSEAAILSLLGFKKDRVENGEKTYSYKLNYPEGHIFHGNEIKALFRRVFKKCDFSDAGDKVLSNPEKLFMLWHIIYSLPEENQIKNALSNKKYFDLPEQVIAALSKLPEFKSNYASLSQKAILNLLPLMRVGKYWKEAQLDGKPKNNKEFSDKPSINLTARMNDLLDGKIKNLPDNIQKLLNSKDFSTINERSGLPTFLAAYIAYGRHSEKENDTKYQNLGDFNISTLIPYNSMRNPVVEKVIRETLKLVKEVWKMYCRPDFIHVELARELKKNNKEKEELTTLNIKNRLEKERIISLLAELKTENFNPDSQTDVEKFRIWAEQGGDIGKEKFDALFKSKKAEIISNSDIEKYRLWAEQGYRSPYSGMPIPLSWLYAEPKKVEIDHIIPKSKYFDDSFSNKVLVEAQFNAEKGNRLAIQFIEDSQNQNFVHDSDRKVLSLEDYKILVDEMFTNKKKKKHLKLYEVPEGMVERQMNDTKYISKAVAQFLKPVAEGNKTVHEDGKITFDDGLIYTSGEITSQLKTKWGLNHLWKEMLKPRFERLEKILGEKLIVVDESNKSAYHFMKDYKRVDHRHHALDALVIACTTRGHIKYLNSLNSFSNDKKEIAKYNEWSKWKYLLNKKKQLENQTNGMYEFDTPWHHFYQDAKNHLESVVVSHKPGSKLISKAINKYYKWRQTEEGLWVKTTHLQVPPKDEDKYWVAVRQSLFGQPLGRVHLPEYKKGIELKKVIKIQIEFIRNGYHWNSEEWRIAQTIFRKRIDGIIERFKYDEKNILKYLEEKPLKDQQNNIISCLDLLQFKQKASKRVTIDESFSLDKINAMPLAHAEKNWLTTLLKKHLEEFGKDAFKGENLEMLFKKANRPINKVTRVEGGNKIERNNKLLDGDKGVNQYFVIEIYKEIDKKTGLEKEVRKYFTPNFLEVIERLAKGLPIYDEKPDAKYIVLSPGDLVYVPDSVENIAHINWSNKRKLSQNIYIMKSSTVSSCYFLPMNISSLIEKGEFESLGKSEKTIDGSQFIKANFIKLSIDRLGNIKPYNSTQEKRYPLHQDSDQSNLVSEPTVLYQSKPKLSFYKNFEDMEKSRLDYNLETNMLTRIKNTVDLIKRVYDYDSMDKSNIIKKLYFK